MNRDDVCELIAVAYTTDSEGYETKVETSTQVFCKWTDGVTRSEFYQSHKAGFQASASVEIVACDYNKQKLVDFHDTRYSVIRAYYIDPDHVTLILEEVVR